MKNKKGFTIVELLGVIIILGILLLIGIPTISKYINRGKAAYYIALEKEMRVSGSEYLNTYRTLLPRVIGHSTVISLEEIEANNYIDPVVDEDGEKCTGQVMATKRKKDGYDYTACLKCGTKYTSSNPMCKVSTSSDTGFENNELDNIYEDSSNYRVVFDVYEYEVGQSEEFILPTGRVEHLENGEWKEINAEPVVSTKKVDTNTLGTKTVIYSYHGSKTEIKINVVDKVAPSKPETVIKYESANGNDYQENWYSGKLYVEFKSTDYTKKNLIGSGIKNYEYSLDGENWIEVRKDNDPNKEYTDWLIIDANADTYPVVPKDGEYTIRVRAKDKNDNVSGVNTFTIRIDTKAPDCKLKVTGDIGLENWYKSGITVEYDTDAISGTTSEILTTPIVAKRANGEIITTGTNSVTINTPEENIRVYGTITDQAGNVTVCEAPALDGGYRLKLDPTTPQAPQITVTDGNGVGGRWYTGNNSSNPDEFVTTPNTNVWHINDTTMTFSGANNLSKNIYFYTIDSDVAIDSTGRATNATGGFDNRNTTAADIKAVQSTNTTGTTYYVKVCSVAGNCSTSSNYIVKLDKTTPAAPTFTAVDSKPLGDLWYIDATNTSSTPISGVWHIVDTTLNLSGAGNISGNIYNYQPNSALTVNSYGRPNGTRGTSTTINTNTPAEGTTYYSIVCSVAGRCSSNANFLLKIDKSTPNAPTMTATDGKGNNVWHYPNVVVNLTNGGNVSGNIYMYREGAETVTSLGRTTAGSVGSQFTHAVATSGTTYYARACSVAGKCGNSSSYSFKVDTTPPIVSNFHAIDGDTAEANCADPESGVVSSTVRVSIDASTITAVCTNGGGGTSSTSHGCGYNGCKYGHNTCAYGCDSVWNPCHVAAWCEPTTSKVCSSHGSSSGQASAHGNWCAQTCNGKPECNCNCSGGDGVSVNCSASWCSGYSDVTNPCGIIHPCEGAYEDQNCSSCKTGENTCRGGYTW